MLKAYLEMFKVYELNYERESKRIGEMTVEELSRCCKTWDTIIIQLTGMLELLVYTEEITGLEYEQEMERIWNVFSAEKLYAEYCYAEHLESEKETSLKKKSGKRKRQRRTYHAGIQNR